MTETKTSPALSVVIPCYNEESTLARCVDRVLETCGSRMEIEIIIVDDASRDASAGVAAKIAASEPRVHVLSHMTNSGKGAALRTGFAQARGDYIAIQDADLEYDPADLPALVEPLMNGQADVVIGSRFTSGGAHRVLYFWHSIANRVLTLVSNAFTDLNLTDIESCYKVFRREVLQGIDIRENRFGFEPEIVAKVALRGLRIYEMGISYHGRTYEEGKKITAADGLRALYCILRYNLPSTRPPVRTLYVALAFGGCAVIVLMIAMILLLFQRG